MIVFANTAERTFYEFTRLHMLSEWWHWLVLLTACVATSLLVATMYRRDTVDVGRSTRWTLLLLRICAFGGLLFFFLGLEKKTEQRQTRNSRIAVLVDTSQSMGISDIDSSGSPEDSSRIEKVIQRVTDTAVFDRFRQTHDVQVFTFSETSTPSNIATFLKTPGANDSQATDTVDTITAALAESRSLWIIAAFCLGLALISLLLHVVAGVRARGREGESWFLLAATVITIVGFVFAAVANLRQPNITPAIVFGWDQLPAQVSPSPQPVATESTAPTPKVNWSDVLVARGVETRLGDAIRAIVEQERGGPISGVVVITDGAANAGIDTMAAAEFSKEANVAIYPVGVGSDKSPVNTRVVDIEAPSRVFPGDNFTVKAYLQASGIKEQQFEASLLSSDETSDDATKVPIQEQLRAMNLSNGKIATVEFEVTPDQIGKRVYTVALKPLATEINKDDNRASASVEIIERKTRVLLFAGGPTRDFRFLRNQLFRDKETTVDILLQTAVESTAQESDALLSEFPTSPEEMFEYDCVIAFDPDWTQLSNTQIQLVERWVAEKGWWDHRNRRNGAHAQLDSQSSRRFTIDSHSIALSGSFLQSIGIGDSDGSFQIRHAVAARTHGRRKVFGVHEPDRGRLNVAYKGLGRIRGCLLLLCREE